jgi:hypothetical protein
VLPCACAAGLCAQVWWFSEPPDLTGQPSSLRWPTLHHVWERVPSKSVCCLVRVDTIASLSVRTTNLSSLGRTHVIQACVWIDVTYWYITRRVHVEIEHRNHQNSSRGWRQRTLSKGDLTRLRVHSRSAKLLHDCHIPACMQDVLLRWFQFVIIVSCAGGHAMV